ncbi:30S ribosomal protein S20 [candidate division KSB1 bacterium]|nr:MAG: 30S ribosomal protein S20 [candidate division KSB1 bacterium]
MPQHKSAEKRMRTSAEARIRNRQKRTRCRAAEKKVLSLADKPTAQVELAKVFALLDHMATKGLYHQNTTARIKAKLSRHVGSLQG